MIGIINYRLISHKKVFSKEVLSDIKKKKYPIYYGIMTVMFILYIAILFVIGIEKDLYANLDLISYLVLTPMLVSAFIIDYKKEIIPNRLVLTIFETGLIFVFLIGILNPNGISIAFNRINGMLAGGGIFLIITLLGGLIAGKEAMGFGDVKFMGALGLYFGFKSIIMIAIVSFLLGAILSIGLLIFKVKKTSEYIPFGPFIVMAVFVGIFIPEQYLFSWLWFLFSGQWFLNLINK